MYRIVGGQMYGYINVRPCEWVDLFINWLICRFSNKFLRDKLRFIIPSWDLNKKNIGIYKSMIS